MCLCFEYCASVLKFFNVSGDVIIQQNTAFLSAVGTEEDSLSFQLLTQRLDAFFRSKLSKSQPELLKFREKALLLSHGQATVERGFSINKEVEPCNMYEGSLEALRMVCGEVAFHGVS